MSFSKIAKYSSLEKWFLSFRMYHQQPDPLQVGEQEKAARSVFVGNIPYEATEEQLKAIFTEIGVVLSFRLVYDRETGKPKGMTVSLTVEC